MSGTLFIVATPLGNGEDISVRAVKTLRGVHIIFCEDTRVTKHLVDTLGITTPLESYHQHSGPEKIARIARLLAEGNDIAVVTDAGTPGISDPGNWLIHELLAETHEMRVVPIPGPNAAIAALSVSGFPTDRFLFLGFPPTKKGRSSFFKNVLDQEETVVLYESVHRIIKTLTELAGLGGAERTCVVGRELTKIYETIYRGTIAEVLERLQKEKSRGEYVIILAQK